VEGEWQALLASTPEPGSGERGLMLRLEREERR
jgi:hypothetical protein